MTACFWTPTRSGKGPRAPMARAGPSDAVQTRAQHLAGPRPLPGPRFDRLAACFCGNSLIRDFLCGVTLLSVAYEPAEIASQCESG